MKRNVVIIYYKNKELIKTLKVFIIMDKLNNIKNQTEVILLRAKVIMQYINQLVTIDIKLITIIGK